MKLSLTKLKKPFFYTVLFLMTLSLYSCHTAESDAKEVCDCYSKDQMDSKKECDLLYKEYAENYKSELSDNIKFQTSTIECVTSAATTQMGKVINEATQNYIQNSEGYNGQVSNLNNEIKNASYSINTLNKDIKEVKASFYLYSILLMFIGIGLAIYGLKRFKISLALSFIIPTIVLLQMLDWLSMGWFISVMTIGILIFVFSKPLTYFSAWFFITVTVLIPFFMVSENDDFRSLITKIMIAISIVITYLLRKHIKATVIGISSGYSIGLGLASIISAKLFANGEFFNAFMVPGLIMFTGILLGLAYQYKYVFTNEDVSGSTFETVDKNENLSKINLKEYLNKRNGIIASSIIILIVTLFVYQSFSSKNTESDLETEAVNKEANEINQDKQTFKTDEILENNVEETSVIEQVERNSDENVSYDELIGEWKGTFGNDQIALNIENINTDGSVTGYDKVKNNRRELSGYMKDKIFVLNEPGDDKWDGVFKFSIIDDVLTGTWSSNNGKLTKEYTLTKALY